LAAGRAGNRLMKDGFLMRYRGGEEGLWHASS